MENLKYVSEMNKEELTKVFYANDKLQHEVYDDMVDNEMFWVGKYLDCFKEYLNDWSIGSYGYNYIKVDSDNLRGFVDGVEKLQKDFCFLVESENEFIAKVSEKVEAYYYTELYSDEYYKFQEEAEELVNELADKITSQFNRNFSCLYQKDTQLSYFLEFYVLERFEGNEYIIADNNDYKLYKEVTYTKKYA